MSSGYVDVGGIQVEQLLERFLVEEALPGSGTDERPFWLGFVSLVDGSLRATPSCSLSVPAYKRRSTNGTRFTPSTRRHIGSSSRRSAICPLGPGFEITTERVDLEMAELPGLSWSSP